MKSVLRTVEDHGVHYQALMFICPGCAAMEDTLSNGTPLKHTGLHMLPVNNLGLNKPNWDWDGNLELPTLSPSILTHYKEGRRCHSFLKAGVFEFLNDSTHSLAGQKVPLPDLPDWV